MPKSIHEELRHRGEPLVEYPAADLWQAVGGSEGVAALSQDLYRRIEQDELLREAFPHFNSGDAASFFAQWFGGSREYSDGLEGGLLRRHQHRYVSPQAAAAWLRCMRAAVVARGLDAERIMRPLARLAKAMIHSPETKPRALCKSCDAVQEPAQVEFEKLLEDAAKGRTEVVRGGEQGPGPRLASRHAQPHAGLGRDVLQPPENPGTGPRSRRRLQCAGL